MSDCMIKSGLKKADAGLMSTCYHPAHKQWDTNSCGVSGPREPYAAFRTESCIAILSGASLQEIRRHEGWDYGAL
jgi:hypothetical protein